MEIEEVVGACRTLHPERTSRYRLGRIPAESEIDGVVCGGVESLDAKVTIIDETVVRVGSGRDGARPSRVVRNGFNVFNAAAHAVEGHDDVGCTASPQDGAVLAIVGDGPDTSRGLDECLVSVKVELRCELFLRRAGDSEPYQRVLVKAVGCICTIRDEVERREAVSDVVALIGVFVVRRVLDRVGQLVPVVVAVGVGARLGHSRAGAGENLVKAPTNIHILPHSNSILAHYCLFNWDLSP